MFDLIKKDFQAEGPMLLVAIVLGIFGTGAFLAGLLAITIAAPLIGGSLALFILVLSFLGWYRWAKEKYND